MREPFEISPSSIPSKLIRFKIQDVREVGFGKRGCRFTEDKSLLTPQFVDSFTNFQAKTQPPQEPHISQENQKTHFSSIEDPQKETKFHYITPSHKEYLNQLYEKQAKSNSTCQTEQIGSPAYTFAKSKSRECLPLLTPLPPLRAPIEETPVKPRPKLSAVFHQEQRWAYEQRNSKIANGIGPGEYQTILKKRVSHVTKKALVRPKHLLKEMTEMNPARSLDLKRVQGILDMLLPPLVRKETPNRKKEESPSYIFAEDDRDRFGHLKYPIAASSHVPGPGEYELKKGTIGDNLNRLLVIEEQKKLLKQWFDN